MGKAQAHPEGHRGLVLDALGLLRRLGAATAGWQRSPSGHGVTVNQALVLHHLVEHGDATPSALADWMRVTRGTITPTLQRLEELGLAARRADKGDARKQWLHATAAARRVAPQVEAEVLRPALAELASWPPDELRTFVRHLQRLLASPVFGGGGGGEA